DAVEQAIERPVALPPVPDRDLPAAEAVVDLLEARGVVTPARWQRREHSRLGSARDRGRQRGGQRRLSPRLVFRLSAPGRAVPLDEIGPGVLGEEGGGAGDGDGG